MIKAVIFDMFETLITHYACPLYFSQQMADEAGIEVEKFLATWRPSESDRSVGKISFEGIIEQILKDNNCYSDDLLDSIVSKRVETKKECFRNMHKEIVPMLKSLKDKGMLIGLISNCFSEEAMVIRESELAPYFDEMLLSWEQGVQKPDVEIFKRCMNRLGIKPDECLYIGDGGSNELETARSLGMETAQAVWYLQQGNPYQYDRKDGFVQLESPLEVLKYLV